MGTDANYCRGRDEGSIARKEHCGWKTEREIRSPPPLSLSLLLFPLSSSFPPQLLSSLKKSPPTFFSTLLGPNSGTQAPQLRGGKREGHPTMQGMNERMRRGTTTDSLLPSFLYFALTYMYTRSLALPQGGDGLGSRRPPLFLSLFPLLLSWSPPWSSPLRPPSPFQPLLYLFPRSNAFESRFQLRKKERGSAPEGGRQQQEEEGKEPTTNESPSFLSSCCGIIILPTLPYPTRST